jgi:hypothetical protein
MVTSCSSERSSSASGAESKSNSSSSSSLQSVSLAKQRSRRVKLQPSLPAQIHNHPLSFGEWVRQSLNSSGRSVVGLVAVAPKSVCLLFPNTATTVNEPTNELVRNEHRSSPPPPPKKNAWHQHPMSPSSSSFSSAPTIGAWRTLPSSKQSVTQPRAGGKFHLVRWYAGITS